MVPYWNTLEWLPLHQLLWPPAGPCFADNQTAPHGLSHSFLLSSWPAPHIHGCGANTISARLGLDTYHGLLQCSVQLDFPEGADVPEIQNCSRPTTLNVSFTNAWNETNGFAAQGLLKLLGQQLNNPSILLRRDLEWDNQGSSFIRLNPDKNWCPMSCMHARWQWLSAWANPCDQTTHECHPHNLYESSVLQTGGQSRKWTRRSWRNYDCIRWQLASNATNFHHHPKSDPGSPTWWLYDPMRFLGLEGSELVLWHKLLARSVEESLCLSLESMATQKGHGPAQAQNSAIALVVVWPLEQQPEQPTQNQHWQHDLQKAWCSKVQSINLLLTQRLFSCYHINHWCTCWNSNMDMGPPIQWIVTTHMPSSGVKGGTTWCWSSESEFGAHVVASAEACSHVSSSDSSSLCHGMATWVTVNPCSATPVSSLWTANSAMMQSACSRHCSILRSGVTNCWMVASWTGFHRSACSREGVAQNWTPCSPQIFPALASHHDLHKWNDLVSPTVIWPHLTICKDCWTCNMIQKDCSRLANWPTAPEARRMWTFIFRPGSGPHNNAASLGWRCRYDLPTSGIASLSGTAARTPYNPRLANLDGANPVALHPQGHGVVCDPHAWRAQGITPFMLMQFLAGRSCRLCKCLQFCSSQFQLLLFLPRPLSNARHDMSHWIKVFQLWKFLQPHLSQSWSCENTPPPVAFTWPNILQIEEHFTSMKSSSLTKLQQLPSNIRIFTCRSHAFQYHHHCPQKMGWCQRCRKSACPFILPRLSISKQRVWLTGDPRCQCCTKWVCLMNLLNRLEVSNVTNDHICITILLIQPGAQYSSAMRVAQHDGFVPFTQCRNLAFLLHYHFQQRVRGHVCW